MVENPAVLIVRLVLFSSLSVQEEICLHATRPRGWHLDETRLRVDHRPVSGSIFDSTSFTTRSTSFHMGQVRISTSPRWNTTSKLASGLIYSTSLNRTFESPLELFVQQS